MLVMGRPSASSTQKIKSAGHAGKKGRDLIGFFYKDSEACAGSLAWGFIEVSRAVGNGFGSSIGVWGGVLLGW